MPTAHPALDEAHAEAPPPIPFLAGSAKLTPRATRLLDGLGRRLAGQRLRVEGHAAGDKDLADRRAKAVAAYLAENCGVDARLVETAVAGRHRSPGACGRSG